MQRRHFIQLSLPTLTFLGCGKHDSESISNATRDPRSVPYHIPQTVAPHEYHEPARAPGEFDLSTVSSATYQPHQNTPFNLTSHEEGAQSQSVVLKTVRPLPVYPRPDGSHATRRPPFALRFTLELPLPQGNYAVAHTALPEHGLFLVPLPHQEGQPHQLEAILNSHAHSIHRSQLRRLQHVPTSCRHDL